MREISKEELNIKNTWIVTELHHERYTFDIETLIYKDKTILEILDDLVYYGLENRLEKYENSNIYIIDEIYHEDKDSDTWCLTEEEKNRFRPLHIGALLFTPLEDFIKDEYMSGCFGSTNRKYGVMDYAKVPVEMEECKNEISAIKTNESKV